MNLILFVTRVCRRKVRFQIKTSFGVIAVGSGAVGLGRLSGITFRGARDPAMTKLRTSACKNSAASLFGVSTQSHFIFQFLIWIVGQLFDCKF